MRTKKTLISRYQAPDWDFLVEEYLKDGALYMSKNAVNAYKYSLRVFVRWIKERSISTLDFGGVALRQFEQFRLGNGISPKTRNNDIIAIRQLFDFAFRFKYLSKNPVKDYKVRKVCSPPTPMPTPEQCLDILRAVEEDWNVKTNSGRRFIAEEDRLFYKRRDQAILAILMASGARISEVLSLEIADFRDGEKPEIVIQCGKGGKFRVVACSKHAAPYVRDWLKVRPKRALAPLLFINQFGEAVDRNTFSRTFRRYRSRVGLEHICLHSFRVLAITTIAQVSVLAAQNAAGHEALQTTQIYLRNTTAHNREAYDLADPMQKILYNANTQKRKEQKPRVI